MSLLRIQLLLSHLAECADEVLSRESIAGERPFDLETGTRAEVAAEDRGTAAWVRRRRPGGGADIDQTEPDPGLPLEVLGLHTLLNLRRRSRRPGGVAPARGSS